MSVNNILTGSVIPKQDTENIQNSLCPVSYKFTARLLHIKELLIQFSLIGSIGLDYIFTSLFPWSLILNLNNGYAVSLKLLSLFSEFARLLAEAYSPASIRIAC